LKSFDKNYLDQVKISQSLLKTIRTLGEYKGKEDLYRQQSPQVIETLKKNSIIQSTESSNRIEGVVADPTRLKALMERKIAPLDRSEQEIAGYRDVLNTIHSSYRDVSFTPNIVMQLHRDLFNYTAEAGGQWKSTDNTISEQSADGTKHIRFSPIPAWQTPDAMKQLHEGYHQSKHESEGIEPLLAIPAYVLDFLCIHPFRDGNGRMARLLTLLLLYQEGYELGRYISLEKTIENTKEGYYDALYASSQGWHEGEHNIVPWLEYFLGVMLLGSYREFERRVGLFVNAKGTKAALILAAIDKLPTKFTISNVAEQCPTVGIDHIRKTLRMQRDKGKLKSVGRGPNAEWLKME
jgi:Fic family protein